jgi:sterol 3beta-glucosyltransferase
MAAEKITILAFGSMGDVVPYLALGIGLRTAGYRVHFVTHSRFAPMTSEYGISSFGIEDDPVSILKSDSGQRLIASGNHPLRSIKSLISELEGKLRLYTEPVMQQSDGSDLLLGSPLGTLVAIHVAEKLKTRFFPAFLQPVTPTSQIPNAFVPTLFHTLPENWASHQIYYRGGSFAFRRLMNDLRRMIGLRPTNGCEPFESIYREAMPTLYGYSAAIVPRPTNWMEHTHVTGYWLLPAKEGWQPPDRLLDFLGSGTQPVCIGFGSTVYRDPESTASLVLGALRRVGCRGIIVTGWGGLKPCSLPDDVFAIESVPYDWLFPRVAAVVHHAGAGTIALALRAGVPSVTVPHFLDQFFWGEQLYRLEAAPRPIHRLKLTADALAEAISIAIKDARLKRNAAYLGERLLSEDGVSCAVEEISRHLRN